MSELLPCPFCSGPAIQCGDNKLNPRHWVMCKLCHACSQGDVADLSVAISAWNTRASQAEIERLKAALSKMANEVFGLSAFEAELRSVMGNTNWSVLRQRAEEARAALSGGKE